MHQEVTLCTATSVAGIQEPLQQLLYAVLMSWQGLPENAWGLCHAAQQGVGRCIPIAVFCRLQPRCARAGARFAGSWHSLTGLSSPGSFCILTPCSLVVIQLRQAALSAFQLSFTAQGCVLQGDT